MKFMTAWKVYETIDEYGRRGGLVGVFVMKPMAERCAKGKGYYGGGGAIEEVRLLEVEGQIFELADTRDLTPIINIDLIDDRKRKTEVALNKLTEEELALLKDHFRS